MTLTRQEHSIHVTALRFTLVNHIEACASRFLDPPAGPANSYAFNAAVNATARSAMRSHAPTSTSAALTTLEPTVTASAP